MPRQLPSHLSDLLHRLGQTGRLFIEQYESKKERMQAIVKELMDTSKEVQEIQKTANTTRILGAVLGGLGIVGIGAALQTGAEKAAMLGGVAAIGGCAAVCTANVTKTAAETIGLKTVEELGKEFMDIIEVQKDILKDIMVVSEELEEKSSSLITTTRAQTKEILNKTKELQQVLKRTAELSERSREVMDATLAMLSQVRELLNFIVSVARFIATPDAKLRNCITDSALQCEKTVHEFAKMRNALKDFEEMQT